MCLRRAPEKYIAGAALDRAAIEFTVYLINNIHFSSYSSANTFLSRIYLPSTNFLSALHIRVSSE
jgi:hypothetical protein